MMPQIDGETAEMDVYDEEYDNNPIAVITPVGDQINQGFSFTPAGVHSSNLPPSTPKDGSYDPRFRAMSSSGQAATPNKSAFSAPVYVEFREHGPVQG